MKTDFRILTVVALGIKGVFKIIKDLMVFKTLYRRVSVQPDFW